MRPTMEVTFNDDRHEGATVRINARDYDSELHAAVDDASEVEEVIELTSEEIKAEAFRVFPLLQPDDFRANGAPTVAGMNALAEGHEFTGEQIAALWVEFQAQE